MNNKLPFLDVLLDNSNREKYLRNVYTKPTKTEECINYECDAPNRYKIGVIKTLINRAYKICNSNEGIKNETQRIKKLLINNNFPNKLVDKIMDDYADKYDRNHEEPQSISSNSDDSSAVSVAQIFYRNQYHKLYQADEDALRKIIRDKVLQVNVKIKLCIYYKNKKIKDCIMKNNMTNSTVVHADKSHLIYEFICPERECQSLKESYIGLTSCTLRERFINHRNKGSIFAHYFQKHGGQKPEVDKIVKATNILYHCDKKIDLHIFEALFIRKFKPSLNENTSDFTCLSLNIF